MTKPIISFNHVSYSYQNGRDFAFKDIDLQIPDGSISAVLGMNGVGKTTLLLLMLGYLHPNIGKIRYADEKGYELGGKSVKRISYLPQFENLPLNITVDEYVLLGRLPYVAPLALPSGNDLDIVKKHERNLRIDHLGKIELGKISGGELQRVRICRALAQESAIILLDEPISHLDIKSKYAIMEILAELKTIGKTIVFSSHDPIEAIKISDHALMIFADQQIKFGRSDELISANNLSKCLDIRIEIVETTNGLSYQVIDQGDSSLA